MGSWNFADMGDGGRRAARCPCLVHGDDLDMLSTGGTTGTAVVEPRPGVPVDEDELIAHVKGRLAAYEAPKRVVVVDGIGRAPNGKVDYARLRDEVRERLDA